MNKLRELALIIGELAFLPMLVVVVLGLLFASLLWELIAYKHVWIGLVVARIAFVLIACLILFAVDRMDRRDRAVCLADGHADEWCAMAYPERH